MEFAAIPPIAIVLVALAIERHRRRHLLAGLARSVPEIRLELRDEWRFPEVKGLFTIWHTRIE